LTFFKKKLSVKRLHAGKAFDQMTFQFISFAEKIIVPMGFRSNEPLRHPVFSGQRTYF
jgi:hypothetical protein